MVLATGTAALVFVGAAVILLLPAFSAARRKASEAVERQAAHDAATRPEPAPQPVAAPAVTPTPLDEAGLPSREADPAIAELETFARDLALTAIRLRQVIEPVKTLQEAVRVAPEVARLGKILGSAEERQKAIPNVTSEQATRIDQKYQEIITREMAATSKELERYEALAKAPAMKTASRGPVTEMVVQGNTAVPTKSLRAQGAGSRLAARSFGTRTVPE